MSEFNLSAFKRGSGQIAVDLAASGVAFKERLNQPVVPEIVAREVPEELREYFLERCAITASLASSCRKPAIHNIQKWLRQIKSNFSVRYAVNQIHCLCCSGRPGGCHASHRASKAVSARPCGAAGVHPDATPIACSSRSGCAAQSRRSCAPASRRKYPVVM
jgi:DNA polymerase-3 subunit theta